MRACHYYSRRTFVAAMLLIGLAGGCLRETVARRCAKFCPVPPPQNNDCEECVKPVVATLPYSPLETYPLRVGDQLQFTLSIDPRPQEGDYRLAVNDQVSVEYLHEHEPSPDGRARTMKVLPNGTIDLPLIGQVAVADKTVAEVKKEVNKKAEQYWKHPQIAVTVLEATGRKEELRKAFTSNFSSQSLNVVISPEGDVNLPEVGTVFAFGKSLAQLRIDTNQLYEQAVPGVHVWPHLTQRASDHIYVLGEVHSPGRFLIDRPMHVSQAIAMAGGWNLAAELHEVVLIRYRECKPEASLLDLHHAIRHDRRPRTVDLTADVMLADADVIIVPKDKVQNCDDVIRRVFTDGIYGVIPVPHFRSNN